MTRKDYEKLDNKELLRRYRETRDEVIGEVLMKRQHHLDDYKS